MPIRRRKSGTVPGSEGFYGACGSVSINGEQRVRQVWFHRSFGAGTVSGEAVRECKSRGIQCIVGGCPLMYCEPVDLGHRCFRSWLRLGGRVPG